MVESTDVYRIPIASGTWHVEGPAQQLTRSTLPYAGMSLSADGRMLLSSLQLQVDPWSVPLDANSGTLAGEPRPIVQDSAMKLLPACSRDGRMLAYVRWAGLRTQWRVEVRLRDLRTGQETSHAGRGAALNMSPRLSADGSLLAYGDLTDGGWQSYVVPAATGSPRKICDGCTVIGFLAGGNEALVTSGPYQFARHHIETGRSAALLKTAGPLIQPDLSPDDHWAAFVTTRPDSGAAIYVASLTGTDVIPIAEGTRLLNSPRWSPDGNLLYYISNRDGRSCVWAQRLDPVTKKPRGEAFAVLHLHRAAPALRSTPGEFRTIAVGANRLFLPIADVKGNIWTAKLER